MSLTKIAPKPDRTIPRTVKQRVKKGADWLDSIRPDWFNEIRTDTLRLDSATNCVLGQLAQSEYPDSDKRYWEAVQELDLCTAEQVACGFDFACEDEEGNALEGVRELSGKEERQYLQKLTDAWKDAITKRRKS